MADRIERDEMSKEMGEFLDDLERCDGYNPCGECDRCTAGGKPWREARAKWLSEWEDYLEGKKIERGWGG